MRTSLLSCSILCVILCVIAQSSAGQQVVDTKVPRLASNFNCPPQAGEVLVATVTAAYKKWLWNSPDYHLDGHVTENGAAPYSHQHALKSFPCSGTLEDNTVVQLTTFGVGVFYYCVWGLDPNITVLSPASMAQNCHGYTTGIGSWIYTDPSGIGMVLAYDYQTPGVAPENHHAFTKINNLLLDSRTHSHKIDYECGHFGGVPICYQGAMTEKVNVSPVIRRTTTTVPGTYTRYRKLP